MADILVRRATHQDFDAVMNINKEVYQGFDYLPSKYHEFLADPRFHLFVAEISGRVVGFNATEVSADKKRLTGIAGRTHPDYQNKGVSKSLASKKSAILRSLYPSAEFITFTAVYSDSYQMKVENGSLELTHQWNVMPFKCRDLSKSMLKRIADSQSLPVCLNNPQAMKLLQNKENQKILFKDYPGFVTSTNWHPHSFQASDIKLAVDNANVRASFHDSGSLIAVSFDHLLQMPDDAVRIDIYYYGSNEDVFLNHIKSVLNHYLEKSISNKFYILLAFPVSFNRGYILCKLTSVFGMPIRKEPFLYNCAAALKSRL